MAFPPESVADSYVVQSGLGSNRGHGEGVGRVIDETGHHIRSDLNIADAGTSTRAGACSHRIEDCSIGVEGGEHVGGPVRSILPGARKAGRIRSDARAIP